MAKPANKNRARRSARSKAAATAAAAKVKFCPGCGFQLRDNGTCPNTRPPCKFGGARPPDDAEA
jgi:ribosomal protein L32